MIITAKREITVGLVGSPVVRQSLSELLQGRAHVVNIARDPRKICHAAVNTGVHVIALDFSDPAAADALVDGVSRLRKYELPIVAVAPDEGTGVAAMAAHESVNCRLNLPQADPLTAYNVMSMALSHQGIRDMGSTDPVTGLMTRANFNMRFQNEFVRANRGKWSISVLLADIDFFKTVNDSFGHEAGDNALRAIGSTLRDSVRNIDLVSRWGGEEFCALLLDSELDGAEIAAERIRLNVAGIMGVADIPDSHRFTISLGVFSYSGAIRQRLGDIFQKELEPKDLGISALLYHA